MKKAFLIIGTFLAVSFGNTQAYSTNLNDDNIIKEELIVPYSKENKVLMYKVVENGVYSLWKCESKNITNYPLHGIIYGKTYNYFVYKNNTFHLTVNDINKNDVYNFFTNSNEYNYDRDTMYVKDYSNNSDNECNNKFIKSRICKL